MKRVLYLLLFITACKSSSEKTDRIALVTEKVLDEDIVPDFFVERFGSDIAHVSDVGVFTQKRDDGYVRKKTTLTEYLFKDGRLHQIATHRQRMENDTMTIEYDAMGRVVTYIYSDGSSTWGSDRFKYDSTGRRIEKNSRLYSNETRHVYEYYKTGDSLLINTGKSDETERIYISRKGENTIAKRVFKPGSGSKMYEYNKLNQIVGTYNYDPLGNPASKVIKKYDSHGNLISSERHWGEARAQYGYENIDLDESGTFTVQYTYDGKGNWTSKKEVASDTSWSNVVTRKITYR